MLKNRDQPVYVVAVDQNGRRTGLASSITAQVSVDGAAHTATNDPNPTEIGTSGVYRFDLLAAETNGDQIDLVYECSSSGVEVIPWPSHYPESETVANVAASGSVTGGLFSGTDVRVYQDDDVEGDFAIVFDIVDASIDFSGVTAVLFDAGTVAGTPLITGSATIVSQGPGSMRVSVAIANTDLQGDAQTYPYSLKAVIGTKRHTVYTGTVTLAATYQSFR